MILFGKATRCDELRTIDAQLSIVRLLAPPDPGEDCDSIDYDRREVVQLARDHLLKMGCRRIAYLGPDDDRGIAFQSAGREKGIEVIDGSVNGLFVGSGQSQAVQRAALEEAGKGSQRQVQMASLFTAIRSPMHCTRFWLKRTSCP